MSAAPAHTYRGGNHQNQRLYDRLVERRTELILRSSNSTTDDYEPLILARGIKGLNKWLKTAEVVMEVQPQELEPTPRDGIMYRDERSEASQQAYETIKRFILELEDCDGDPWDTVGAQFVVEAEKIPAFIYACKPDSNPLPRDATKKKYPGLIIEEIEDKPVEIDQN
ncbi:hypothetical protein H2198_008196 [Neophaeococcomyces mojaviensis]|uniref:Uncharacterized protein n=1 Tax=Neophaeococcomyces mojaviensis TaxID=3383035 RepID=A0ACC2ZY80_9EURO|nr:hypothetical protein H2198_008196 [Knufia sp. JES_112]